jgi:hypothetical protein
MCDYCHDAMESKMPAKATGRHGKCQLEHLRMLWKQCTDPRSKAVLEDLAQCVIHNNMEYDRACLQSDQEHKIPSC